MLTRRTFLLGAAAATAWGCTSSGTKSTSSGGSASSVATTTTTTPRKPGERPDPSKPEGTDLLPQIDHVVVVMMENHSFDNYLGVLGRGDGFTLDSSGHPTNSNTGADGNAVRAFHMANTCQLPKQPSQAWNPTHVQWNDGGMDGFVRSDSGPVAMGYWTGDDLPFYYALASTFPVCDRWFGSCMAQTFPNRRFLLAGTARGNLRTDLNTVTDFQPPNGTIMDSLGRNGIEWRDYYTSLPTTGLFAPVLQANADKVVKIDQFFTDAAAGKLPAFCLVEPDYDKASEENSDDISLGEAFVSSVVKATMASPNWAKTMLIWTYDEHGGYYDHVPPPAAAVPDDVAPILAPGDVAAAYDRYGMRVPAVIVSPWARADYVSSVVHDHTSVMALLQRKFNLPALTARDAAADDLLDSLDLTGDPAFLSPSPLPPPGNTTGAAQCDAPGPVPNPAG